ncbi:hypothetical protein AYI69_g9823 [Smittium culicis]|uniref:Uncharacterized protein n=1 Tax=Smittium culicis TaxID=133412 RepID=A0A1R1XA10_9FUNG|nr:hypothetical protein AYI69_g9823 [Smittium culicis]
MSATASPVDNHSPPVRTPPVFGDDYEEDMVCSPLKLSRHLDPVPFAEINHQVPTPSSTLEITEKCRSKVKFDPQTPNLTLFPMDKFSNTGISSNEGSSFIHCKVLLFEGFHTWENQISCAVSVYTRNSFTIYRALDPLASYHGSLHSSLLIYPV